MGWRLAFLMGPVLALVVIIVGRVLPESPRWLMTHGHTEEAEKEMAKIEAAVRKSGRKLAPVDESNAIEPLPEKQYGYLVFLCLVFRQSPRRAILGATLMITQSFFVQRDLLLLRLRASSAYLTVSETWPIEIRAEAIAVFFAIGSLAGALGPAFYGALIGDGSNKTGLFIGYLVGAAIMLIGGLVEVFLGVNAAGKSPEAITKPLTSVSGDAAPAVPAAASASDPGG